MKPSAVPYSDMLRHNLQRSIDAKRECSAATTRSRFSAGLSPAVVSATAGAAACISPATAAPPPRCAASAAGIRKQTRA